MIHIAGLPVKIGRFGRQRCGWCGLVLFDVDLASIAQPLNPDGSLPDEPKPWETGALVEMTERNGVTFSVFVPHKDGDDLPDGSCFDREMLKGGIRKPPPLRIVR